MRPTDATSIRVVILLLACAACGSATAPGPTCVAQKRAEYAKWFAGQLPDAWLASNVWRIDPVTTVYFSGSCVVTVTHP